MYRKYSALRSGALREEEDSSCVSGKRYRILGLFSCVLLFAMMAGYLFLVNRNAVAGYSLRTAEKRMLDLDNEAQKLRIREAELRSLYGLEEASSRLDMKPIEDAILIDEPGTVAYGK